MFERMLCYINLDLERKFSNISAEIVSIDPARHMDIHSLSHLRIIQFEFDILAAFIN